MITLLYPIRKKDSRIYDTLLVVAAVVVYFQNPFSAWSLLILIASCGFGLSNYFYRAATSCGGAVFGTDIYYFAATEEKTEEATPHRKQEARKRGQVARSTDLNAGIVILAAVVFLYLARHYMHVNLLNIFGFILGDQMIRGLNVNDVFDLYNIVLSCFLQVMAPIFILSMAIGLLANFFQVGFLFAPEAIKPKIEHLNPVEGLKRMFSKKALVNCVKTLLKIGIVSLVIYALIANRFDNMLLLPNMGIFEIVDYLEKLLFQICMGAGIILVVLAVLDFAYQKWEFKQNLKMSRYEIKHEMKQTEGDPLIKSRLREKQRLLSMRRMMQSVPEATVVITNPTHLAVALKYEEQMVAPQVVAKGANYLAEKIKAKAKEHQVPVVEDKHLARALYSQVEVGEPVPVELYKAVAEIIAAIYLLRRQG
ncbi:MAG: flagellar biosynthesis protein FlhB [Syntrophomonadaceae bacterium]|jgi:flagellar biosynthetic protein FlhB